MSGSDFDDLLAGLGASASPPPSPPSPAGSGPAFDAAGSRTDDAPGWFGKLPLLGDFAHRRLPQPVVDALDDWLSKGMEASRGQLGDEWLDVYLTGPLWRFALAPGVVGPDWWFGVMMPSVDNVGRYFPLLVLRPASMAPETGPGIAALEAWYAAVSAAVLGLLQPGAHLQGFEAALAAAPRWPDTVPERRPAVARLEGRERFMLDGEAVLAQWVAGVALREGAQFCAGRSLWWPDHANTPDTSLSVTAGLPEPAHFALLLEGEW